MECLQGSRTPLTPHPRPTTEPMPSPFPSLGDWAFCPALLSKSPHSLGALRTKLRGHALPSGGVACGNSWQTKPSGPWGLWAGGSTERDLVPHPPVLRLHRRLLLQQLHVRPAQHALLVRQGEHRATLLSAPFPPSLQGSSKQLRGGGPGGRGSGERGGEPGEAGGAAGGRPGPGDEPACFCRAWGCLEVGATTGGPGPHPLLPGPV